MKFLVDQHLPPALARFLDAAGHPAQHVRDLGLKEADDRVIWRHAGTHGSVMVSKDEDFHFLALSPGDAGRLVWVKSATAGSPSYLRNSGVNFPPS